MSPDQVERTTPADPAPSPIIIETSCTSATNRTQGSATGTFKRVYRVRSRRPTWARSTSPKSRYFVDERAAAFHVKRLLEDGWLVEFAWARRGVVWHPELLPEVGPAHLERRPGCQACDGSGTFLAEVEALSRPCPLCRLVAS